MIVVTVELRSARTGTVKRLGHMVIANDATGTRTKGNYSVRVWGRGKKLLRTGEVIGHARLSLSVWALVRKAIEKAFEVKK